MPTVEVYEIKHAEPDDLIRLVTTLVPGVVILAGPTPGTLKRGFEAERLGEQVAPSSLGIAQADPLAKYAADAFVYTLILSGDTAAVNKALQLLARIDQARPQIMIEVKVLEFQNGSDQALGVSWNFAPNGTTAGIKLAAPSSPTHGTFSDIVFGRISRNDLNLTATLDAAIQENKASLLAAPKILVLDDHKAQIFIGDEITYLLNTQATISGTTSQTGQVRVGVELNVVARSHPDGTITLRLHPEVGRLVQFTTLSSGIALPQISRRFVDTQVRLKNGETLVIGGLIENDDLYALRKVPFLGDLPFFGHLFRHTQKSRSSSEIIILLKASTVPD
jgi:type II secretory pathway component GspD/PulD (secretin)